MNNIQKLLDAVLTPLQDVENALMQCLNERTISTATGINLDVIGKLVGEPRATYPDDDTYRLAIQARIQANRSSGTVENVIKVTRLIINDTTAVIKYVNHGNGTALLSVQDIAVDDDLAALLLRFIKDTQAGGVRTTVQYGVADPATWAHFDAPLDFDDGVFVGSIQ